MDKGVFVRLVLRKGVKDVDLRMLSLKMRKEIYSSCAKLFFEKRNVVDAVYCWKEAGDLMPKNELIKIANNEYSQGNKSLAVYIYSPSLTVC